MMEYTTNYSVNSNDDQMSFCLMPIRTKPYPTPTFKSESNINIDDEIPILPENNHHQIEKHTLNSDICKKKCVSIPNNIKYWIIENISHSLDIFQ